MQSGQPGGQLGGSPNGGYSQWGGGGPVGVHQGYIEQGYRESLRDMNELREFMRTHPDYMGGYQQLLRSLNPAYTNPDELSRRLSHEVLPGLERLELELRRKLDEKNSDQVRSAGTETIPPGYSDKVADYFRKLSKGK